MSQPPESHDNVPDTLPGQCPDQVELTRRLAEPFARTEVKFKPAVVSGNRAMALAYVDARVIQDRLDEVLGPLNWQDDYEVLADGSVVCRLRLRLGSEWVTKVDVGSPSEQPDAGDRLKAAFSDALKRAAVKFGVGRYLYRLPAQWVDYDPQRRQFIRPPTLPDFALPTAAAAASTPPQGKPATGSWAGGQRPDTKPPGKPTETPQTADALRDRIHQLDSWLHKKGWAAAGALITHMRQWGLTNGCGDHPQGWNSVAVAAGYQEALAFAESRRPAKPAATPPPAAAAGQPPGTGAANGTAAHPG